MYNEYLSGNKKKIIPTPERKAFHVYHQYVLKLKVIEDCAQAHGAL